MRCLASRPLLLPSIRRLSLSEVDEETLRALAAHGESLHVERKLEIPQPPVSARWAVEDAAGPVYLRHFCATQLLEMGIDHFAVSVQLGHEHGGALVMSRYGHPSKEAARERY
jgi:hypothetical protein